MPRQRARASLAVIILALLLHGCAAVGPDYVAPAAAAPGQWNAAMEGGLTSQSADMRRLDSWWETLDDQTLTSLIRQAIEGNLDLREALSRIRAARANVGISRAGLFPSVTSSGSRSFSRSSEATGSGDETDFYSVGLDAGWEIDIFGGVRRSVEAARAEVGASEADLNDVLVILVAEVALNYVDVRTLQARLTAAESNLAMQEQTYELVLARYEAGLIGALDVEQARYNLAGVRAQIPSLRAAIEQAWNRLAFLLGKSPGALGERLTERRPIPSPPIEVAVGVPAEALRRRPDVRRAERRLAVQTARVGEATAELYPKFQLPGSIGLEAFSSSDLFLAGSHSYRGGPSFTWPIFTAGRIRQNIRVQDELARQALLQYERTILAAFEEVENALAAYADEQLRRNALDEAAKAAGRAVDLAEIQYASGLIEFQAVLDAQRSLLSFQEQLAQSEGAVVSNLIRLYKALGGGWTSLASAEYEEVVTR